jgi:hypothetical protein
VDIPSDEQWSESDASSNSSTEYSDWAPDGGANLQPPKRRSERKIKRRKISSTDAEEDDDDDSDEEVDATKVSHIRALINFIITYLQLCIKII